MRVTVMIALVLLAAAAPCRAEDPLESLNTVEETLSQLAQYRSAHASRPADTGQLQDAAAAGAAEKSSDPPKGAPPPQGADPSCCQEGTAR